MAEMTNFNMVGLGVLTQVGVAGKDFPAGCASKVSVIVGVLAMFDYTCKCIKMPWAFITTINILLVVPRMINQHTFTQKFSTTPRARKLSTLHLCKFDPAMVHFVVLV